MIETCPQGRGVESVDGSVLVLNRFEPIGSPTSSPLCHEKKTPLTYCHHSTHADGLSNPREHYFLGVPVQRCPGGQRRKRAGRKLQL